MHVNFLARNHQGRNHEQLYSKGTELLRKCTYFWYRGLKIAVSREYLENMYTCITSEADELPKSRS